jgi:hypothetical protein
MEAEMTRAQELEMRRLTQPMWQLLRYAKDSSQEAGCPVSLRTGQILARRGFLTIKSDGGGYYSVDLTEAGHEALAWKDSVS